MKRYGGSGALHLPRELRQVQKHPGLNVRFVELGRVLRLPILAADAASQTSLLVLIRQSASCETERAAGYCAVGKRARDVVVHDTATEC